MWSAIINIQLDLPRTITLLGLIAWCILLFRVKRLRLPKGKKDLCHPWKCRHLFCFLLDYDLYAGYDCDTDACHCQYVPSDQILPQKRMRPDFMRSIQLMIIHKPDGYSANATEEIAARIAVRTSSGNAKHQMSSPLWTKLLPICRLSVISGPAKM